MTTSSNATGLHAVVDWPVRAAALAEELAAVGKLASAAWRAAVESVPRHMFVPSFYVRRDGRMVAVTAADPATRTEWSEQVYANTALVTKIGQDEAGGPPMFLSSSSTPGLMTRMLEALDVRDGARVLEIGTGTGYHAALLCHRLGDEQVFSVDVEPDLVDTARARLAELGYRPTLVAGDGAAGLVAHAPFDRVIATCSVPAIPLPWVEQTRSGGVILADVRVGLAAGNLVRLTRTAPDRAEGMFDAGQAAFMELRHAPGAGERMSYARRSDDLPVTRSVTTLDPRTPWSNPVVWFLTALRIGGHYRLGYAGVDSRNGPDAVSITTPDGSRAEITLAVIDGEHIVAESGPVRLWQHLEHAHRQWEQAGRPSWPRLGLTVTTDHQSVYVDEPGNRLAVLTGRQ
ncbi:MULTISPECIES: methyltransferase domain-containing protein [Actinoalloteichus]|uniref:Protein-L-isoaspartate O-methyltransferase n=1 Tax=Actinoalloteichus fjordicus TaxID=1612552 RepID=A0AAC9LHS9_9PSEU|nr:MULTISPECIES: methyltransferase domain-containing protein [Actinoalloteichus]APU16615.1 protein-L-isoaspartate carboxylmethyltransferase [Actinoalloteichus fjordicus]APU22681.1 protein-L-isoaspartate carboxylmethyltransferase [Actinoalloteichus sp. GBA129-24]